MHAIFNQIHINATASRFARPLLLLALGASLIAPAQGESMMQAAGEKPAATMAAKKAAKTSTRSATLNDKQRAAMASLEKLLQAYASGEQLTIEPYLDPAMVGAQALLEHMRETRTQQKQIRTRLKEIQTTVDADAVVFTAQWEKRYLALPGMTPKLASGKASFLMRYSTAGWRLSGISGDNIFAAHAS